MNELVSILLPVYNVEKFLEKCIVSILNQTYTNFELILVNDGSTDSSLEICRRMEKQDSRIRVVDKPNGGLSSARNAGLEAAQGEYILFLDSDDWIEPDMLECLYSLMTEHHADLSVCNFYAELPNGEERRCETLHLKEEPYVTDHISEVIEILEKAIKFPYSWNRLYRMSIIRAYGIRFEEFFVTGQDLDFNLKYVQHAGTCVLTDKPYYHYINHGTGSLCARYKKDLYAIVSELSTRRQNTYRHFGMLDREETARLYERTHVDYIATCVPNMFRLNSGLNLKEKRRQLRQLFRDERVRQYVGNYHPRFGTQKIFGMLARINSPDLALAVYCVLFWIRNHHDGFYHKIKR